MESKAHISYDINITSIMDNIPPEDIYLLSNSCGVYILTFLSGKRYVGSSKTLKDRLNYHHRKSNENHQIKSICIYVTENEFDSRLLEKLLIKDVNPEINKRDLFPIQKCEIIKIPKETYDELKKIQSELYEKHDIRITLGNILSCMIKLVIERHGKTIEWLVDSIKAEKDEKNKKKQLAQINIYE